MFSRFKRLPTLAVLYTAMFFLIFGILFIIKARNINNFKIPTDRFNVNFILNGSYIISQTNDQYMISCLSFNITCNYVLMYNGQNATSYVNNNCIKDKSLYGYIDPSIDQCFVSSDVYPHFDRYYQGSCYALGLSLILLFGQIFLILLIIFIQKSFTKDEVCR